MFNNIKLEDIAAEYKIKLIDMTKPENIKYIEGNGIGVYTNSSVSCGDEIHLGIYDSSELRVFHFFHELAHCLRDYKTRSMLEIEYCCWSDGMHLARKYNVYFSGAMIEEAVKCVTSYISSEYNYTLDEPN